MEKYGRERDRDLTILMDESVLGADEYYDLRGFNFNFSEMEWNERQKRELPVAIQPKYSNMDLSNLDLSYSVSDDAGIWKSKMSRCRFDCSKLWGFTFSQLEMTECSFDSCVFGGVSLSGKFGNCVFDRSQARGGYFAIGHGDYINCSYLGVHFKEMACDQADFKNCKFSGMILKSEIGFYRNSARGLFASILSGHFKSVFGRDYRERSVSFVNCNFSDLEVESTKVHQSVSFDNCISFEKLTLNRQL